MSLREELQSKAIQLISDLRKIPDNSFYDTSKWKKARDSYIQQNPFCELCLDEGHNIQANLVHHIVPILNNGPKFSLKNLIALCKQCHDDVHSCRMGVEIGIDFESGKFMITDPAPKSMETNIFGINPNNIHECKINDCLDLVRIEKNQNYEIEVHNKQGLKIGHLHPKFSKYSYLTYDMDRGWLINAKVKTIKKVKDTFDCVIIIERKEK